MKATGSKAERRRSGSARDPAGASRFLAAGAAHVAAGRLAEAAAAYEQAERADPDDFRATFSLATIDVRSGRLDRALPRLRRVTTLQPSLFEAQHNLAAAAQALERWDEAAAAFERALSLRPEAVETRRNLAIVLAILGRVDEAAAHHRRLAADPATRDWALTRLALLKPAAVTDDELEQMRRSADDEATDADTRVGLLFGLGEVLERRGDDAAAFAAFEAGNRRKRAALRDDGTDTEQLVAAHAEAARIVAARFTPDALQRRQAEGLSTASPIFIVGMPRSGSTLIEQILASHPQVVALGETAALPALLERGFATDRAETRALARRYLEAIRGQGWTGVGRFVDKTLENYLHVGAISVMFPKAVILHSVREAADTCLSCYRQLFARGSETLYDLGDIGAEYVAYRGMMEHWRAVLPGRVIDIDHEALVADPDRQIRWLVTEVCGLGWHEDCLAFHKATGPVRTASSAQVRQPIFNSSVARWRRYEAELGPLLAALGPYAPKPQP